MHPSASIYSTKKTYKLEDLEKEMSLEKIKVLFAPINFDFEEPKNVGQEFEKNVEDVDVVDVENLDVEDLDVEEEEEEKY